MALHITTTTQQFIEHLRQDIQGIQTAKMNIFGLIQRLGGSEAGAAERFKTEIDGTRIFVSRPAVSYQSFLSIYFINDKHVRSILQLILFYDYFL